MIQKTEKIRLVVVAALVMVLIASCDPTKKYEKEEEEEIQGYLTNHSDLVFDLKESGLYYLDITVGTGMTPIQHDTVYVMLKGSYLEGYEFTNSYLNKDTIFFPLGENVMIQGLEEGISYMHTGGKSKLLIPSSLTRGSYLPAYTPVLFEVELVKIVPSETK